MDFPLISVLTPSFNSGDYIERALQSVCAQTYQNYEHIVVDGGSTDKTLDILKTYSHIKWLSEPDAGQSDAMNKAFALSSGELIVYLNADDSFAEGAFEAVIKGFSLYPDSDIIVGNVLIVRNGKQKMHVPSIEYKDLLLYYKWRFPLNPTQYFYKRHVQETTGAFPTHYHYAMDYWFLLKAYHMFSIKKINVVLGTYYFHNDNKSGTSASLREIHRMVLTYLLRNDFASLLFFCSHYWLRRIRLIIFPLLLRTYHIAYPLLRDTRIEAVCMKIKKIKNEYYEE